MIHRSIIPTRSVALASLLALCPSFFASRVTADEPPPIEKLHPSEGHTVDDLERQAKEMKDQLALGKTPQDARRQTQELTRMRALYGSICSKAYRGASARQAQQCGHIKDDLSEANRRLARASR